MKRLSKWFSIFMVLMLAVALLPAGSALAKPPTPGDGTPDPLAPVVSGITVAPDPVIYKGPATVTATLATTCTQDPADPIPCTPLPIVSAEYQLNGLSWLAMTAQDGAFDSPSEVATVSFTATVAGKNTVCVRGTSLETTTDVPPIEIPHLGDAVCVDFLAQYNFKGFYPPVKMDVVNKAKAGRTVPLKWRLTAADGSPIKDPATFQGVWSYQVDCVTKEVLSNPEMGKAPGKSGPKYQGKGKWHYNWKTDKKFSGTCRMMYVQFDSGLKSPEVMFQFK